MIHIKTKKEIELMRRAGKLLKQCFDTIAPLVREGVTGAEIDREVENFIVSNGAKPSFKGYNGFPAASCISINDAVVHGVPDQTRLVEGDIVGIDIGLILDGYHSDAARTYTIGRVGARRQRLVDTARECFFKGIEFARDGNYVVDIARAVQTHAESNGFSVVRTLTGHGIGRRLHEDPSVPNFVEAGITGARLKSGMTIAIEPMINEGAHNVIMTKTVCKTADASASAHYENTVLITNGEPEILTL